MMAMMMVACAVLASLAGGVLVAYALAMGMFRVFRMHSMAAARAREQRTAPASQVPLRG